MDATTIISIGAWVSVWVLFVLFIRHLYIADAKYKKIRAAMLDLSALQTKATSEQKEFHKGIAALMVAINQNLATLKDVNIENVTEVIKQEVDKRLKHVAQ